MPRFYSALLFAFLFCHVAVADEFPTIERRLPPNGKPLDSDVEQRLTDRLNELQSTFAKKYADHALAADIAVYLKAVDYALQHGEFYKKGQHKLADDALRRASDRMKQLSAGETPWTSAMGLLVRGYTSSIDDSPQPYGLVIPEDIDRTKPAPLYVWLHGRGDTKTDLHFLNERQTKRGHIAPKGSIVLHPFGRQCIGYKSAGEIDVLEAIEHVCSQYKIDRKRIVLMGFSMGGAGCWHLGAHYTDHFVAMSPGAGFAETAQYQRLKKEDYPPTYEQRLWGQYDVPNYVRNLFNIPVVAYSGEIDKQVQAARVMEVAFQREGRELTHLIGPGMGHKYHPDSLAEILRRMAKHARDGQAVPTKVSLQTRTLRYNKMYWAEATGLQQHWSDSRIDAEVVTPDQLTVTTQNISRFHLRPPNLNKGGTVSIDGQKLKLQATPSHVKFVSVDGTWQFAPTAKKAEQGLRKRPQLQGPIDDAFLARFLVVQPTGTSTNERVQAWVDFELQHLQERWRALFRGELPLKRDVDVTEQDIADTQSLILFGDPSSNQLIAKLAPQLPIEWTASKLQVNGKTYSAEHHVPVMIYPNPEQPTKYIVLNSGPTFREGHDRTNSLQNPKLPDWAVLDLRQPPNNLAAGKVVSADFFDEEWTFK